jgi:hypothetical protein
MKYLILFLLTFTGCSNNLKVGDCYLGKTQNYESMRFKILKVGKYSYESEGEDGKIYVSNDKHREQTDCWF